MQGTGGSTAIANSFEQYRKAGAVARAMLSAAAAIRWGVAAETITVANGVITSGTNQATFGDLAADAARLPVPSEVTLKDPKNFVYIGKSFPRLDFGAKTTGARIFTQDVQLDGMLVATLARAPMFGGLLKSVDDSKARAVKGVVDIVKLPQGVAVLAKSTYAAIKGREALTLTWDDAKSEMRGSDAIIAEYKALAQTPGKVAKKQGDAAGALAKAAKVIEAEYVFPFLAHAPMEPLMRPAIERRSRSLVRRPIPDRRPERDGGDRGLKPEQVTIHTLLAGGSSAGARNGLRLCRRGGPVVKAAGRDVPVKLVWTREDDIKRRLLSPALRAQVRVALDDDGHIVGWQHRIVGQSIIAGTPFESVLVKDGIDGTSVEGVADLPYAIPTCRSRCTTPRRVRRRCGGARSATLTPPTSWRR